MLRFLVKSKIQCPRITDKNSSHEGSITVDEEILQKADIVENEQVQVINADTGERFETFVIKGKRNSGEVCLNGGAARFGEVGNEITIISYAAIETISARGFEPKKVFVDKNNHIINDRNHSRSG